MKLRDTFNLNQGLHNWGRFFCLDMARHGINPQPAAPITSRDYRSDIHDYNIDPPPDEDWALEIQEGMVRLAVRDTAAAMHLTYKYRDGWTLPLRIVHKARYRLWRVM